MPHNNNWCVCRVNEGTGPSVVYEFNEHKDSLNGINDVICPSKKIKRKIHNEDVEFSVPVFDDYIFVNYDSDTDVVDFIDNIENVYCVLRNANGAIKKVDYSEIKAIKSKEPVSDDVVKGDIVRVIKGDYKRLEGQVINVVGEYVEVEFELFSVVRIAMLSKFDIIKT